MDLKSVFENPVFSEKFALFEEFLAESNKKFNLTAITDKKDVYIKHFCDSILPQELFFHGADVVEIGSGGGFPSLPLKIVRNDLTFTLVESIAKKCTYLREAVDKLELTGVTVENMRAEDCGRRSDMREKFDICTARAVAKLNTLSEYCLPLVKKGGIFIAYKSGDVEEELKESLNAVKILGGAVKKEYFYELPEGMGRRCAVVIEKVALTDKKYPRGQGKEKKSPL